jgi:ribonuclease HII
MIRNVADFSLETAAMARGLIHIAGVDEVGRGPLCGPVVAAAVILDPARIPSGIGDSKTLTPARRAKLAEEIRASSIWALGSATVEEIDRVNILQATYLAMRRALSGLSQVPAHILIDGNRLPPDLPAPAEAIVQGDAKCLSIAAASILAKVARDLVMVDLAQQFPGYGWERNAGYPTKDHLQALLDLGVTPHHRRSFRPVHNILYQEVSISR